MWVKRDVVMLPTNEKAILTLKNNHLFYNIGDSHKDHWTKDYNLYILSDEEIKEGDWFIYNKKLYNRIKRSGLECTVKIEMFENFEHAEQFGYKDTWVEVYKSDCKKIIATTDKSLKIDGSTKSKINDIEYETFVGQKYILPQIAPSFINFYVEKYNKGNIITEVMVEYEEFYNNELRHAINDEDCFGKKLKINPDNTININTKAIKDSWTRDEVEKLCSIAYDAGIERTLKQKARMSYLSFEQWLKENI